MNRFLFSVYVLGMSALALGQSALDAAKNGGQSAQVGSGTPTIMPLVQLTITALVLFGLFKWIAPKAKNWIGTKMDKPLESDLRIEQSATLAQGALYVVSLRGRSLLLGVTAQQVNLLCDLTEQEKQFREEPAFFEQLDEAMEAPLEPVVVATAAVEIPGPRPGDRLAALLNQTRS